MTALLLGLAVGLVLGLTGAGGSAVAVPLLMWGLGWTLPEAVPVALLAVAASAAWGTWRAWRKAYVRYRAALLMAAAALLTAPFAVWLAPRLPLLPLTLAFAVLMAYIGLRMFWQAHRSPADAAVLRSTVAGESGGSGGPICRRNPDSGRLKWTAPCLRAVALTGAVTGLLSGLFGVGGGFVIVPALRAYSDLSIQSAIATSLMAITLISALTVLLHFAQGHAPPLAQATPFALGAVAGMMASGALAPRLSGRALQQGFGVVLGLMAILTAARALT